jgi:hypothetical protein
MTCNVKTSKSGYVLFQLIVVICLMHSSVLIAGLTNDSIIVDAKEKLSAKYQVSWELWRPSFIDVGSTKYLISGVLGEPFLGSAQSKSYIIDCGYIYTKSYITVGFVTVKVIPQGFYNAGGYLNAADTIHVLLASATTPYKVVDSADVVLDSLTFSATATLHNATGGSYYLVVKHRSCVETWSANCIILKKGGIVNYDFTTAATQAYGGNETQVASGVYAIYSGDCNQDNYVDPLDLSLLDQDMYNYVSGLYLNTDVNGDKYVDPLDLSIVDQNSYNYVGIQKPSSSKMLSAKDRAKTLPYYQKWFEKKVVK